MSGEDAYKTYWPSIYLMTFTHFFIGLQFSIFMSSMWPFFQQIDPTANAAFLGYIIAAFSIGQCVTSPIFGFIGNRIGSIRYPAAIGAALQLTANLTFANAEQFTTNRRWVLFCARLLLGIGAGNVSLYKAYLATGSTVKDRPKALALASGAFNVGVIIGPGLQVAYTGIGYPGFISGGFHLNTYTAAAYTCAVANVGVIVTLLFFFKEQYCELERHGTQLTASGKNGQHSKPAPVVEVDKVPVAVLVWAWACMMFVVTNGEALNSPFSMVMFGWTEAEAVQYCGIIQAGSGLATIIIFTALGKYLYPKINERLNLIFGFSMLGLFYLISFPWPGLGNIEDVSANLTTSISSPVSNATIPTTKSCSEQYDWCETTPRVHLVQYLVAWLFQAFGFPSASIVLVTLYSRVLGPQRQGTMQGLIITAGSSARAIGPVLIGNLFESYGPSPPWIMMMLMLCATVFLFLLSYGRLVGFGEERKNLKKDISKIYPQSNKVIIARF